MPTKKEAAAEPAPVEVPTEAPDTLTYGETRDFEGLTRLSATDSQGMTLTVDAESKPKAQAALRAAFKSLKDGGPSSYKVVE